MNEELVCYTRLMSSLSCGVVGLPNVGKSTLFNALTNNHVVAANYPFATIEPNTGTVPVPDERLAKLAELYHTEKVVPATVTFVDIAGLVAGASKGEGLGNQFLGHIRTTNAILHVVRNFNDANVQHVDNEINPKHDIETINTELILADLQTIERRLPKLEKEARANPKLRPQVEAIQTVKSALDNGKLASDLEIDHELIEDLQLITDKPVIYVFNSDEEGLRNKDRQRELSTMVAPHQAVFINAQLETELQGLDEIDAKELLESYGQGESGLYQIVHAAYEALGLQSFLTAGEKEVRAWTIPKSATAQQAAGVIHTDFAKGFIAAEIVSYADLLRLGSLSAARAAGLARTEGKDYHMQPDDIVEFRFNV